ncbi:MAG: HD-like signal output (HDOD) protein/signal transduction histidine kinase [Pseudohongiellaceae bacterium]
MSKKTLSTHKALDQFPSLPQVLVKILDAIHSESADFQQLANIIRQDPAVSSKLIQVASSSYFGPSQNCSSIERALMFLGTDAVKTIVITSSIKQFFGHFNQDHQQFLKQFWRRSLITANFAQALATLTRYPAPKEAYLCGLLTDLGQLILLTEFNQPYLSLTSKLKNDHELIEQEQIQFNYDHCEVAADLIDSWKISEFMGDAIRYHHEDADQIQDAQHLVKIIYLSNLLGKSDIIDGDILATSHNLFGLNESLTTEIHGRILSDVTSMAASLNIDVSKDCPETQQQAHHVLGKKLGELGELTLVNQALWQVNNKEALEQAINRAMLLTFGIHHCRLFEYDSEDHCLRSEPEGQTPLAITVQPGRSLSSEAILNKKIVHSLNPEHKRLTVIDRQLLRLCQAEQMLCLPLINNEQITGVLVLGLGEKPLTQLTHRFGQLLTLGKEIAIAQTKLSQLPSQATSNNIEQIESHIREAVHEASNPLSIIRNYLEMLRIKLGDEHSANENLDLIKEEIDRVGSILLRLNDPQEKSDSCDEINLNELIKNVSYIFNESICTAKKISISLQLDEEINHGIWHSSHLKQILTNLIKNACEALSAGHEISISTEANVNANGHQYTAIMIADNGPGMPKEIKEQLFTPLLSSKGGNHSGLGLSIVKKLIDGMGGSISCRSLQKSNNSERSGTEFQILLPQ